MIGDTNTGICYNYDRKIAKKDDDDEKDAPMAKVLFVLLNLYSWHRKYYFNCVSDTLLD